MSHFTPWTISTKCLAIYMFLNMISYHIPLTNCYKISWYDYFQRQVHEILLNSIAGFTVKPSWTWAISTQYKVPVKLKVPLFCYKLFCTLVVLVKGKGVLLTFDPHRAFQPPTHVLNQEHIYLTWQNHEYTSWTSFQCVFSNKNQQIISSWQSKTFIRFITDCLRKFDGLLNKLISYFHVILTNCAIIIWIKILSYPLNELQIL